MADTFLGNAGNLAEAPIVLGGFLSVVPAVATVLDHYHGLGFRGRTSDSGIPGHNRGQGALLQLSVADPVSLIPYQYGRPFVVLVAEPGRLLATVSRDVVKEPRQVCNRGAKLSWSLTGSPSAPLP
jgi:hypothetical protein